MSKHTPEPWNGKRIGIAVHYFESIGVEMALTGKSDEAMANARRIVACVNFCAGVSTENLENNEKLLWLAEQYNSVKNQRDDLLAALEAHEKFWTIREAELGELSPEAKAVRDAGLAAIAKAKGGAA